MTWRIGYLGPPGSFSEAAARSYLEQANITTVDLVPCRSITDVLAGVGDATFHQGVVPVENSSEGAVAITLDYLAHEAQTPVTGEVVLTIEHHLLALPTTSLNQVSVVHSHPQALAQCRHRLGELLPQVYQQATTSTSEAARLVSAAADKRWAALGTKLAAELYGLQVLVSDIQDSLENVTRFWAVGGPLPAPSSQDKTSIVFSTTDQPGSLYKALEVFAIRHINLSKLESRPAKRNLGEYIFFADLIGHAQDAAVADALGTLAKHTPFFKILGSYPCVSGGGKVK